MSRSSACTKSDATGKSGRESSAGSKPYRVSTLLETCITTYKDHPLTYVCMYIQRKRSIPATEFIALQPGQVRQHKIEDRAIYISLCAKRDSVHVGMYI
jgi:hypothetical protein